ncbi:hypothetical protein MKX03_019739 [Papaver bracteatum]|nr:hypothetical protein MKX03_019739 [Papaver bracteatum]
MAESCFSLKKLNSGGNSALVYASKYHDAATVGYLDFIGDEGTQYRVTEDSLLERLGTDMHALCLSIAPDCRVFSVYGDVSGFMKDLCEFAKAIPNHKTCSVQGADHNFSNHQSGLVMMVMHINQHHP